MIWLTWERWSTCWFLIRCLWPGNCPLCRTEAESPLPGVSHCHGTSCGEMRGREWENERLMCHSSRKRIFVLLIEHMYKTQTEHNTLKMTYQQNSICQFYEDLLAVCSNSWTSNWQLQLSHLSVKLKPQAWFRGAYVQSRLTRSLNCCTPVTKLTGKKKPVKPLMCLWHL